MVTVVKIGGSLHSKGLTENLFEDIKNLSKTEPIIVVHGGGNTVTTVSYTHLTLPTSDLV